MNPETLRGRNWVDDEIPRCYIHSYDNSPLLEYNDDIVVLEWDIAVGFEDLELFCEIAADSPDKVMVAPYRLYPPSDARLPDKGVWAHRKVTDPTSLSTAWVTHADLQCDLFSLGFAYLPRKTLEGFAEHRQFFPDKRMTDANFSLYHYRQLKEKVPICWAINPVHLHYHSPSEFPWI